MMRPKLLTGTFLCLLAMSCGQHESATYTESLEKSLADTTASISSDAANSGGPDSAKFIRTADIRFRVCDVQQTTFRIEDIVRKHNGYIAYTHLASTIENTERGQISKDSTLERSYYTVSNTITIRVPNDKLDTTLREIAGDVVFLDHRTIQADDVTIQYLENTLGQKRYARVTKIQPGAKQKDINETGELSLYRKEKQDEYYIANRYLDRDINYSVVTMDIYQSPRVRSELVAHPIEIIPYRPGLITRAGESFLMGWRILEDLLVWLIRGWGLILAGMLIFILLKNIGRKNMLARVNRSKQWTE